jgi:predicted DsbA family dithiol-disulfide isomerase
MSVEVDMHIDVWSDVICPWCYLGKRRLEAALAELGWGDEVEVRWRAYQLDPHAGPEPGDLRVALERKYGPGAFESMTTRLTALGEAEGLDYRFDRALRVNTADAHRLMAWAWAEGGAAGQGRLAERLFRAYFTEGVDVSDHATLAALAAECGLDPQGAAEVLAGRGFADEVADELNGALELQITGVPAFLIEGRFMIPGAQDVDTFVSVLTRARERMAPTPAAAGEACAVDDPNC